MKINTIVFSIIVGLTIRCTHFAAQLPEAPIEVRLARLSQLLAKLRSAQRGDQIVSGTLQKKGVTYELKWRRSQEPPTKAKETLSWEKAFESAVGGLKDDLPEGLRPETENLISLARYEISGKASPEWIWVAEFTVDDERPIFGAGYQPTLFVILALDGALLVQVEKK